MSDANRFDETLKLAERAAEILREEGIETVVIGALALAAHNYPRATEDVDLAISTPPLTMRRLADRFRREGWLVDLREPDGDDPLGGVIDVRAAAADLVQVVNFDNAPASGFPRLVREALPRSIPLAASRLRVVDLPMLIAFKLYAGGTKSTLDIHALLERNDVDRAALAELCASLGLSNELERVLAMLR